MKLRAFRCVTGPPFVQHCPDDLVGVSLTTGAVMRHPQRRHRFRVPGHQPEATCASWGEPPPWKLRLGEASKGGVVGLSCPLQQSSTWPTHRVVLASRNRSFDCGHGLSSRCRAKSLGVAVHERHRAGVGEICRSDHHQAMPRICRCEPAPRGHGVEDEASSPRLLLQPSFRPMYFHGCHSSYRPLSLCCHPLAVAGVV